MKTMKSTRTRLVIVVGTLVTSLFCGAASDVHAEVWVGFVRAEEIDTHDPSDPELGNYYTFTLGLPTEMEGREIRDAILECYVDVDSEEIDGYVNDTPTLQLFILDAPLVGEPTPAVLRFPSPAIRNVRIGAQRRVALNVRGLVAQIIESPSEPPELIMGSLTGIREGKFVLRSDVLPAGAAMKVIVWYR